MRSTTLFKMLIVAVTQFDNNWLFQEDLGYNSSLIQGNSLVLV
jgi:hypothetical protein